MLGMYVHTHWGYNHPYAARTWTVQDWQGYLSGLRALGYDLVMFWPLLDAMPPRPTASDRALLARTARVIEMAHDQFGMRFIITVGPNVMGNERAADYGYEERPYFVCERKVDPRDRGAVEAMLAARRWQFEALGVADGIAIIDSDPGGYVGSTNEEFVDLLAAQTALFRQFNPRGELLYWMWVGWENYNRFWAEARQGRGGDAEPRMVVDAQVFADTLAMVRERIAEPWAVFVAWPEHLQATRDLGLVDRRLYIPYGTIEGEPSFPLTNYSPATVRSAFDRYPAERFPLGAMGNAQSACLQLPHIYLFAHYAQGGSDATVALVDYAEGLLPGLGETIAAGWEAIGYPPEEQRRAAVRLRHRTGQHHAQGTYAGLLFGDADRFLADLAANLELRAALADLQEAAAAGERRAIQRALRAVLDCLEPYQQRLGFADAYGGPLYQMLNEPLSSLRDPELDAVLGRFHDWRNPAVRHEVLSPLLRAMARYAQG